MMTPKEKGARAQTSHFSIWLLGALASLLLYVLSFGPVYVLLDGRPKWVELADMFYWPLFQLSDRFKLLDKALREFLYWCDEALN